MTSDNSLLPNNPLLLDNQLCFALYSTSLAMTQFYKEPLSAIGLTYPQYTVMLILWEQDGVSLKHISDALGQKSGALTPVIKRMEADGLVKRLRGVDDDRSLSIALTEKGKKLREQGLDVNRCVAEACGMDMGGVVALREQLVALRNKLIK
ncbi:MULTISPECIES: MarR family winged helix-turn-helix transcriptional regulator [Marinomonas]|uniref:MarR family transcriptional regulator n=1 Tax=Marinomonas arctica TaxID=383750 RepID=A0A7H1J7H3_9GAMM|nr:MULTISPECIES: MarR family transcriptional regulator [Marinomonas]MCS7485814.1 MarR family transcriptional regulator [Marinomonas sp. BSi20414]QNT06439.1 MarR family transcriptional regulator [Marinomonas arctica]GGN27843.1 transcriptional regulator [Marinomonas arctica]